MNKTKVDRTKREINISTITEGGFHILLRDRVMGHIRNP